MRTLKESLPTFWLTGTTPEWLQQYIYNLVSEKFDEKVQDFIRIFKSPNEEKWESYV
jgi:hypothetical protein